MTEPNECRQQLNGKFQTSECSIGPSIFDNENLERLQEWQKCLNYTTALGKSWRGRSWREREYHQKQAERSRAQERSIASEASRGLIIASNATRRGFLSVPAIWQVFQRRITNLRKAAPSIQSRSQRTLRYFLALVASGVYWPLSPPQGTICQFCTKKSMHLHHRR